jgi:hypothetical protein
VTLRLSDVRQNSMGLADCSRLGELMGDGAPAAVLERIMNAYPQYAKTIDGPLVIADAGLDSIRRSYAMSEMHI